MARKNIAVLDFGSSRVSVMIGERGINDTFEIRGCGDVSYAGFLEGEFLQPETLISDVQQALALAENNARCKITHLYVGIPAEFSSVVTKEAKLDFYGPHKIVDRDITDLFDSVDDFNDENCSVINRAPIYYTLDNEEKVLKPKGKISETLSGLISFVLCENQFLQKVQGILSPLHIEHLEFFSEQLSEALYLIEPQERDNCSILVDCGFLTTSVSTIMGDGLLDLKSFSLGSGHIISDFCEVFGINAELAEDLKREISLMEEPNDDVFEMDYKGEHKEIPVQVAYDIIYYRVVQIAKMIKKCIDMSTQPLPQYITVNVTGGGLSYIQGAKEMIQEIVGKDVKIVAPDDEKLMKPHLSSLVSLLDLALKQNKQETGMFFIKLFRRN